MKTCTKCKVEKDESEFVKSKICRCHKCNREASKKWYENNKERALARVKQYRESVMKTDPEKIRAPKRKWEINNKEKSRIWAIRNPEKVKTSRKKTWNKNKVKYNANRNEKVQKDRVKFRFIHKVWRNKNIEKIKEKVKRNIATLSTSYIKNQLRNQGWTKEMIEMEPKIIESTRRIIKTKRSLKNKK